MFGGPDPDNRRDRTALNLEPRRIGDVALLASYPLQPITWDDKLQQLPGRMKTGEAHFLRDEPESSGGEEPRLETNT